MHWVSRESPTGDAAGREEASRMPCPIDGDFLCAILRRALSGIALVAAAYSQPLAPATFPSANGIREQPIGLSPFVVSANDDEGWNANETLAGSRLRMRFKDVPNQIEVLTKEFMDDLGLNEAEQAFMYTMNVENRSDYVPSSFGNSIATPAPGGRVRGLGAGTLSRNFFQVRTPSDNFNLERVTVASGPNAILFGLGSPAGIVDATPARAIMRPGYGFRLQFDSENSMRATFDANVVIRPEKLAVRVMGLAKREFTEKRPNSNRDNRLYSALTWAPSAQTTVSLQVERMNGAANSAGRINPSDFVSLWFRAADIAGSGYSVPKPVFDNSILAGLSTNRIFVQAPDTPVVVPGDTVSLRSWRSSVTVRNPSSLPGVDPTFDATVDFTLLDPAIFPFDINVTGLGGTLMSRATTYTAIIEQKLASGLFVELALNRENSSRERLSAGADPNYNLNVDANRYVPSTQIPNPNFGKFYYQGAGAAEPVEDRLGEWRLTLSYEFSPEKKWAARFPAAKWLGHHRVSGLYSQSEAETKNQNGFLRRIYDDPTITGQILRPKTFQNWAIHSTRTPFFRHYFTTPDDPTPAAGPFTGEWSLTDATGKPFKLYLTDTPLRAADGKRLGASQAASGNLSKTSAQVLAWQGFFLPDREQSDRLVLTLGYRRDFARSATLDAASTAQDFSGLYPAMWDARFGPFGPAQTGINRNVGVVVRPLKWLSVFRNRSTAFDLNIGRYDPFGDELPGAKGRGQDFGVRLDLWADRLSLRINRYENSLGPQRASNQINLFRDIFFNLEDRVRTLDPQTPTINVVDGNRRGFRVAGRPNYFIMSDLESSGYEVELNATPAKNWNIRVNGARSEATESNIGRPWFEWAAQRLPVWQAVVAKNGEVDPSGRPVTWQTAPASTSALTGQTLAQYYNSALLGQAFAFMRAAEGRATDGARTARINAMTNYRLVAGPLKGSTFGMAVRWRAAPTIGYGLRPDAEGGMAWDLDRPYRGKEEFYFDAMIGYRGRMKAFGGFSYRLQLNLRNLLDENDPVPTARITSGAVARLATVEPRVVVATFAVEF